MSTIQRHRTRRSGNKQYYKYVIVIPDKIIKEADLNEGDIVSMKVSDKREITLKFEKRKDFSY